MKKKITKNDQNEPQERLTHKRGNKKREGIERKRKNTTNCIWQQHVLKNKNKFRGRVRKKKRRTL